MSFLYRPTHLTPQHRRRSLATNPRWLAAAATLLVVAGGGWLAFGYTPLWNEDQSAQISAARDSACQRSVTLRLGDSSFLAKPDQVCSWLHPVPQPVKQLSPQPLPPPRFSTDAITQWVSSCIAQVDKPAVNGNRQVDSAGHLVRLLKDPVDGAVVDKPDSLVSRIAKALDKKTGNVEVATKLSARQGGFDDTVVPSPAMPYAPQPQERWVDVNLTNHTTAVYDGTKVIYGPVAAVDGHAQAPTVQGVYKVYAKLEMQTMTGVGFDGPYSETAPWISYFSGDFALHGAPWRSTFVYTPEKGSHGCVNLSVTDAKAIYDLISIGTTVVSHT